MRLSANMISAAVFGVLLSGVLTGAAVAADHHADSARAAAVQAVHPASMAPADSGAPDDDGWG